MAGRPEIAETIGAHLAGYGDVTSVEVIPTLPHSVVARVTFDQGQPGVYKSAREAQASAVLQREIAVNEQLLMQLLEPAAPRVLASDPAEPWVLFADVSTTHRPQQAPGAPAPEEVVQFCEALATVHAQGSQLPLGDVLGRLSGNARATEGMAHVPMLLDGFLSTGEISDEARAVIRAVRDAASDLQVQIAALSDTLMHGDAHLGNGLFSDDGAVLIDWAMAAIGPGEADLCHALALNLSRDRARAVEHRAISAYAARCAALGQDKSEADCLARYKACLPLSVIIAVAMRSVPGMPREVLDRLLENAVSAALDHDVVSALS